MNYQKKGVFAISFPHSYRQPIKAFAILALFIGGATVLLSVPQKASAHVMESIPHRPLKVCPNLMDSDCLFNTHDIALL